MVSANDWQTLLPIKSVPVILCTDNTKKEKVLSAPATTRCPCRWRGTKPGCLSAGLLPSSAPKKGNVCEDWPQFSSKINSIDKKVQNVQHVFKSHAVY